MEFRKIWKNKFKILDGFWNKTFPTQYIRRIAKKRSEICGSNVCGFYDKNGISEKAIEYHNKGKACCGLCGCSLALKTASLAAECTLKELGLTPLWKKEVTEKKSTLK